MSEHTPMPATEVVVLAADPSDRLPSHTEVFLLKKKSFELKVSLHGKNSVAVEVFACEDINLSLAKSIARVQEQLILAEAHCYHGTNFPAYLLTKLDKQGWVIQFFTTPE